MRALGLLLWQCRLMWVGWRAEQTSNAYTLSPDTAVSIAALPVPRCGGHGRGDHRKRARILDEFGAGDAGG